MAIVPTSTEELTRGESLKVHLIVIIYWITFVIFMLLVGLVSILRIYKLRISQWFNRTIWVSLILFFAVSGFMGAFPDVFSKSICGHITPSSVIKCPNLTSSAITRDVKACDYFIVQILLLSALMTSLLALLQLSEKFCTLKPLLSSQISLILSILTVVMRVVIFCFVYHCHVNISPWYLTVIPWLSQMGTWLTLICEWKGDIDVPGYFFVFRSFAVIRELRTTLKSLKDEQEEHSKYESVRGTSAMEHYVALHPMFMIEDTGLVIGESGLQPSPISVAHVLSSRYKEITDGVRDEAATIKKVFSSPVAVMSILVKRVLKDLVPKLLETLLLMPSLDNPPPMEEGTMGATCSSYILLYLRRLAIAYEKTLKLAKDLHGVGCGNLDVEAESLFLANKEGYIKYEQGSLRQLYKAKMDKFYAESQQSSESSGTEFVQWNQEAIGRCTLFSSQPAALASNLSVIFTCLLDQVNQYFTKVLERASASLTEAVASASTAEAAEAAAENGFKSFMVAVQHYQSSVISVQKYFAASIQPLLLPVDVDGAQAAFSDEEMATAMSSAEGATYKGLGQCIETVMAEVERLLAAEQKTTDYLLPDDGISPGHEPTSACRRVVIYLSRVLESAFTLEDLKKKEFLNKLGNHLHKGLFDHWEKFTFNSSGGLRLKSDIREYREFVGRFKAPSVDDKFRLLDIMADVFTVARESLATLFEGTPSIRKDAYRFLKLREDYSCAEFASIVSSWHLSG